MVVALPDPHPANLRPHPIRVRPRVTFTVNQRPRAIPHRPVRIPFALDPQGFFVAFGGLVAAEVDDAEDGEDQEYHDADDDAGDGAGGEVVV